MPPLDDEGTGVAALGEASPSSMDDSEFAKEFGLADPSASEGDSAGEDGPTAEDAVNEVTGDLAEQAIETVEQDEEGEEGEDDAGGEEADDAATETTARAPVTDFAVIDADGDQVDVSGVEITFKANKGVQTLPLDRVVRLAQMGRYNEDLQQEVRTTREERVELTARMEALETLAENRRDLARRLLEDDDFLIDQREKYARATSPEARADRAEARLREVAQREQQTTFQHQVESFVDQHLYPAFDNLTKQYPTVSPEELWGRFSIATAHLSRGGVIPQKNWREAMQMVDGDLGAFAAQLHDQRSTRLDEARRGETTAVRRAQEQATKAKRIVAKSIRPSGQGSSTAEPRRKIVSADDAVDDIVGHDVLNVVRNMR